MNKKRISIAIPTYNEQKTLRVFFYQLREMLSQMPSYDREIIFVNDGSQDATREVIKQLSETNPAVHGINFSANFGKEIALSAGVQHAKGDAVITLDAD